MPSLRMQAYTAVPELVMDVASDSEQEPEAPLIPARMLNEFTYCPRLGVLMWVEDAWAPSHDTVEGTHHHRRVDVPGPDLPSPAPAEGALDESDVSGGAPVAHPGQPSPDAPFVTRSVWLSAESEQLTCKMDLVAATDDEAVPVDTKRGAVPNIPEGAWEPERVQLCAQGLVLRANGWRYELLGACGDHPGDRAYLAAIESLAGDSGAHVHVNVSRAELLQRYAAAKIFVHGAGYGEPDDKPERAEHFGIVTVEAMAAGCVPIVVNRGGQPEIVRHGIDGFVWNTLDELEQHIRLVASDESLRLRLSLAARERSRRFGKDAFVEGMRRFVTRGR